MMTFGVVASTMYNDVVIKMKSDRLFLKAFMYKVDSMRYVAIVQQSNKIIVCVLHTYNLQTYKNYY